MRVEKNERARLIKINRVSQPVKRAGVIIFDVNRQSVRPRNCGFRGNYRRYDRERESARVHRAG